MSRFTGLGQSPIKKYQFFGRFPNLTFPFRNLDNDDYDDDIWCNHDEPKGY